jgi:NhaA family Na+:H+ antiporter
MSRSRDSLVQLLRESAGGIILLGATVVALVWANIAPASYGTVWHGPAHFWVNEGLMTMFFFSIGLEIRREIHAGALSTLRGAALPLAAALGGMLMPAAVFVLLNHGRSGAAGWAVPMATDIAFALGILTLLGNRIPSSLRVLLLALAVIDDIGAIVVIATFYSTAIALEGLALVVAAIAAVVVMQRMRVRRPWLYVAPGALLWAGVLALGVHPTIAGVILALLTPVRPAEKLEHALQPWVFLAVMPVFALANAGVALGGAHLAGDAGWLFAGIVAGLALGKPLGIVAASLAAEKTTLATRPPDLATRGLVLVGTVGGIGFTMSLFIAELAFGEGPLLDTAKLAILVGSGLAMVIALGLGALMSRRRA